MKIRKIITITMVVILSIGSLGYTGFTDEMDHHAYIKGYPDNTIKPNANVTREEAATILENALRLSKKNDKALIFKDVSKDSWSYKHIKVAYDNGLIAGYPNGKFLPKDFIKRAEVVSILARYSKVDLSNVVVSNREYKDHWASKEIQYALDKGIINGYNDGSVKPEGKITRAEFITIINSFLGRECRLKDIGGVSKFKDIKPGSWYYRDVLEATNSHNEFQFEMNPNIPEKHYEVASLKPWIEENQSYLEWVGVEAHIRNSFKSYYNYQVEAKIVDGRMSEDKSPNAFHFVVGNKIGGSLNMSVNSKDGHDLKGITITSYVNNGPGWNVARKPKVENIEKGEYFIKRNIYDLYYDSILSKDLNYHMNPADVIDVDITVDYNDGDFIKYNIRQDVTNRYFNSSYYGQSQQWNHINKPVR